MKLYIPLFLISIFVFTIPPIVSNLYADEMDHGSEYTMDHSAWKLSISPQYRQMKAGETVPVRIIVSTNSSSIEHISASVTFPPDLLKVTKEDDSKSAFSIKEDSRQSSGKVLLSRKAEKPVTGEQEITILYFTALKDTSTAEIIIDTTGSSLMTAEGHNLIPESAPEITQDNSNFFSSIWRSITSFFSGLFH